MKKINIIILCFITGLSACKDSDKDLPASNPDRAATMKIATDSNSIMAAIDSSRTAENSIDWKGTYSAVIPCADCAGIVTEIMLHADSTYMMSVKYLGKKDSKAINSEGKFTWIDGSTIQLADIKDTPTRYLVAENKIVQLDISGKQIEGNLANRYVFNKK